MRSVGVGVARSSCVVLGVTEMMSVNESESRETSRCEHSVN